MAGQKIDFKCEDLLKDKIKGFHGTPNIKKDLERGFLGDARKEGGLGYTYFGFDKEDIIETNKYWWKNAPQYKDKNTKGAVIEVELDTNEISLDPDRWNDLLMGGENEQERRAIWNLHSKWRRFIKEEITPFDNHIKDKPKINQDVFNLCKLIGDEIFKTTWFKIKKRIPINKENIVWEE